MPKLLQIALMLISGLLSSYSYGVEFDERSSWITSADGSPHGYGVYYFRREFHLEQVPASLRILVSADQRYRLSVNGVEVSFGPCLGTLEHWRYETVDLAPFVHAGANVLSAVVWNMGEHSPACQISHRTAFRLQAVDEDFRNLNSSPAWRVRQCQAYSPLATDRERVPYYIVVGPGDRVDAAQLPWNWCEEDFDDKHWAKASPLEEADCAWQLVPREIPALERTPIRFAKVRKSTGADVPNEFVAGGAPFTVPAHTTARVLFDNGELTNAYPELLVSQGAGARITLTYAESLWETRTETHGGERVVFPSARKGNRDEIEGKLIFGNQDEFRADGGPQRRFRPLWFRTYRYVQLDIETDDEPLVVHDLKAEFTGFPLQRQAWFHCDDQSLAKLQEIGWRTLRLCANETQYDCPYYERLQYVGDTRTQACFLRYLSGDDHLPRRAIQDFYDSLGPDGLSQSRYPCKDPQSIPPYSLYWISMLHDDWMWRGDLELVRKFSKGIHSILAWHEKHLHESGMLGTTPGWRFVDWSFAKMPQEVHGGVPPYDEQGRSAILSLQLASTYREASELMEACDEGKSAERYAELAGKIERATFDLCWDDERQLLADTPDGKTYSQHANILGVLAGAIPVEKWKPVVETLLRDDSLTKATVYYRYYFNRALERSGLGDRYLETLRPWHDMVQMGLTTFAEMPEPTRSDCHAWGASPEYEFLRLVTGIRPTQAGFQTVEIAPRLGPLKFLDAGLPTPRGTVAVKLLCDDEGGLSATIELPIGITGTFTWRGQSFPVQSGKTELILDAT